MRASPARLGHRVLAVGIALAATASAAAAQNGTATPQASTASMHASTAPVARAARRVGAIAIDGRLDEAAWAAATPITGFRQLDPNEGEPVSERTEARVLVDGDAVYIGVRAYDSDPAGIQKQLARRDESIEGDLIEVYLDSYHDHNSAVLFRLSPAGARRDASVSANGNQDNSWDAVWEGQASVDAEGWTAEFRIPLSQLRYDPTKDDHTWGLLIGRKIARKAEVAFSAFVPKNEQQGPHRYGHLAGIGRLNSPRQLELSPYVLAKNQHPGAARNDPLRQRNEVVPGAGLDLKYGISSNFTLDATFNPDFGQVEVDPAVVNLSAFETFFPERRPFFMEGANIFNYGSMRTQNNSNGFDIVHTRRIGRQPQRSIGGSEVLYVDAPLETTIAAAAKLTGRTPSGWSVGLMDAVTMREQARFITSANPTGELEATVEPRANYFIGRLKRDLRQGNTTIGGVITTVHRDLDEPELRSMFRSSAVVGGVDWQHAWGNRTWAFDGSVTMSSNRGSAQAIDLLQLAPARYYQRPDRTSHFRDSTRTSLNGHVVEATFAKIAGRFRTTWTYQDYSPGFEVNELGFIGSPDMRGLASLIGWQETKPNRYFRNWNQYLFWNPTWNYDGDMTFSGVGSITTFELKNFWNVFWRMDWRPPVYDDRMTRGGPTALIPEQRGWQFELSSDRRKKTTYGFFTNHYWNEEGGWSRNYSPWLNIRPTTALRLSFSPSYYRGHSVAQYVTQVRDAEASETFGGRYVFATLDQRQFSMQTRVDWTFTPALSLQVFAQPLLATGDFVDYKEFLSPRTFDFAVYGRDAGTIAQDPQSGRYTVDPDGTGPASSFGFNDRDFNQRSLRGSAVLRWEYRPGSALFFVWQQSRFQQVRSTEFGLRDGFEDLVGIPPQNVFVVKATYWLGR